MGATEEIVKGVAKVAKEGYEDALQPAAREVGDTIRTVARLLNVVMAPVKGTVWTLEQFIEFISSRVGPKLRSTPLKLLVSCHACNVVG